MELSIVVTVYNEEENIVPLIENVQKAMVNHSYELIFVDDGSSDKTIPNIKANAGENTRLIILNKNYGQTAAMAAGIDQANGDFIVTIDGDLQNDPSDIPEMLRKLEDENWDVVAGIRANRKDSMVIRKIPSKIANALIRKLTGVHLHDYGCTLKVFRKDIAKNLGLYGELHRFIPVLAQLQGANITEMPVKHHPRIHGESKYGLGRTFKVMSDLLLMVFFQKYLQKPMHLFGTAGIITFMLGSAINMYLLVLKIMGEDIWGRPLLILGITLLLGGVQLITIGLLAELIVRTYFETQNKKTYRIREEFVGSERAVKV
ncbi:glycosyltransferase family 2 protein [Reichenbachiella sp. MALMAid0571]|uniref:glycosyltransferase family 2 protein n=1 Tax=Reichenbachiella sp. MALMAid0571 TaxID=3143939 RepID=UPI0032DF6912